MIEQPTNEKYTALLDMYRATGTLTPAQVVAEATDVDSPLHDAFEWDNAIAGARHRLDQARALIGSYTIKVERGPEEIVRTRAFVHEAATGSYAPAVDVLGDPARRAATVARLRGEYVQLGERSKHFDEFAAVVTATEALTGDA